MNDYNTKQIHSTKSGDDRTAMSFQDSELNVFLEMSPDLFSIVSGDGYLLKINAAWELLSGYSAEELLNKPLNELLHFEDTHRTIKGLTQALSGKETIEFENRFRCKDGSYKWLNWQVKAGKENTLLAVVKDISESKSIKEQLQEQGSILEAITNLDNDAILMLDHHGNIVFGNEAFSVMLGYSKEEVMGKNLHELMVPERYMEQHRKAFPIFQKTGKGNAIGMNRDLFVMHKEGHEVPMELSLSAVKIKDQWCSIGIIRDVTERKAAEKQLYESEVKYRTVAENSNDMIIRFDKDHRHLYANPATEKYLGIRPEDMIGKTHQELGFSKEQYEYWDKKIENIFLTGLAAKEIAGLGEERYFDWELIPEFDAEGNVTTVLSYSKDISEIIKAQRALMASEEKYRMLSENISDVIWIYNLSRDQYTYISPSIFNLTGYTPQETMNRKLEEIITSKTASEIEQQTSSMQGNYDPEDAVFKKIYKHEIKNTHKDGSLIWVETNTRVQVNKHGEIELLGTTRNINDRKLAQETNRKLADLLDLAHDSIIVRDMNSKVIYWNQGATMKYGWKKKEALGRTINDLLKTIFPAPIEEMSKQLAENGFWEGELTHTRKDGSEIIVASRWQLHCDIETQTTTIFEINNDITDQKRAEQRMVQLFEELRETNATKDKLFSIISHDLRGPIGNFSKVLDMLTDDKPLEENFKKALLEELKKAAKTTFSLLENLLSWSRSQTNSIIIEPQSFIINHSIYENVDLLLPNATQKAINLLVKAEDVLIVYADVDSINLVIRNLVSNAIKFTGKGGTITIGLQDKDHEVEVSIADNGLGMTEEVRENLFKSKSFYTTYGTNKEKGSGLGLILCKDFVERNGGEIRVESSPGQGSRFSFTIPKS